ncbi:hypothetical protein OTK49_21230 [Vibrio coralliirubri]|uniref:hypothetical protein n=1 Tax=Vibrio coralliirubri TaxID=1516159 RepID=UPI002284DD29|nr:hypothetical protein [Vibrio coralliirubri]MCY9865044.1 hypothetical protein [Vibrio coralliirubri]
MTETYKQSVENDIRSVIKKLRDEHGAYFDLTDADVFRNHCDIVSEKLYKKLTFFGMNNVTIAFGVYLYDCHESNEGEHYHTWLQWDDVIIDPTRCQFGNREFIIRKGEPCYELYKLEGIY